MSVREFRDDDAGYLAWLDSHPHGYVLNIRRSHNPTAARVHHRWCRTISGQNPRNGVWTGPYVKVCAELVSELDDWAIQFAGEPILRCGSCRPTEHVVEFMSAKVTKPSAAGLAPIDSSQFHGPVKDKAVVQAWADGYIRFEHRPEWQENLRSEIRNVCRQLDPSDGEILHAKFFGIKPPRADVENLLLYNIDTFKAAGRNGIRFEHGATVPLSPDDASYRFCYRYALASPSGTFDDWRPERRLVSFGWTDVHPFPSQKEAAPVWLALARKRGEINVSEPARQPDKNFAVKLQVRAPSGHQRVLGGMVKGIFDGVISAFQAHTDAAVLNEVAARLASVLPANAEEIEKQLGDQRWAVLGPVEKLVTPYGKGVQWHPADHQCVAGELLLAESGGTGWAITGEIVEMAR